MSLARDEVARDVLIALVTNGDSDPVGLAVSLTDALLAALSPAPVVGALAGVESKGQTFTCPKCGSHEFGTSNCTSPFSAWVGHCGNHDCRFSWPRELDDAKYFTPAPAPSPTSYVPKVGDVVALSDYDAHRLIVVAVEGNLWRGKILYDKHADGSSRVGDSAWQYGPGAIFDRPATASERAAAGLPVDEATTTPAPASVEPRRTVGAVVKAPSDDIEFIVVNPGEGESCVRAITACVSVAPGFTRGSDRFVRWATRAECERHGVPFVDRTTPAATPAYPVDAAGRPLWVRITSLNGDVAKPAILTIGRVYRVTAWGDFGSPAVTTDDGRRDWYLSRKGTEPDPDFNTYASWEPCAAPTDAVTPAANPTATWDAAHGLLAVRLAMKGTPVGRTAIVTEDPFVAVDYDIHGAVHSVEFHAPSVTPAAALTEEEVSDLTNTIADAMDAYDDDDDDDRTPAAVAADAAAAWFAKRDGTVKP